MHLKDTDEMANSVDLLRSSLTWICTICADLHVSIPIQCNFSGSNTKGSFTKAVSNSFLGPQEKTHPMQICYNLG